jgi:hypothetical protein
MVAVISMAVKLRANRLRVLFPYAVLALRELGDVEAEEFDWAAAAEALRTAPQEWPDHEERVLRPDEGPLDEHLFTASQFARSQDAWLLKVQLHGNPAGLGVVETGAVLLPTSEFLRLLPGLFAVEHPTLVALSWPDVTAAALVTGRLTTVCDGYWIQLLSRP